MPKVTTSFSTEILGYDNDYVEGSVKENVWSDLNMLAAGMGVNVMSDKNFMEVLTKTRKIVDSMTFDFVDTGVVLPTVAHEFFAEPEETEYKVQTVTITFESDVSAQEIKEFLSDALNIINERMAETNSINDSFKEAMLWHINTEKAIITSMIDTFQEVA